MGLILDYPRVLFLIAFVVLMLAALAGAAAGRRRQLTPEERSDFGVVQGATLTLLGLIIGFTFSMAISRYDQRKTYEEAEANAIGTEYVRADVLPPADAAKVRALLKEYTDLRIRFYTTRNESAIAAINRETARVQDELWAAVEQPAMAQQTPMVALALAGMNDVLNSQGYTQAAWWNRIPPAAWALLFVIAIFSSAMVGYGAHYMRGKLIIILPLLVSVSFFLIADIDSPRRGVIQVRPQNLEALRAGLK